MSMSNVIENLRRRRFVDAITHEEVVDHCKKPIKIYCGFDATADSLHLGNFVPLMALLHFAKCGHLPYILLGGATSMIGDPSGKSKERPLLEAHEIESNIVGIRRILDQLFHSYEYRLVNNYDWTHNISIIDFLRDVGKEFRLGVMLSRETVQRRLESNEGMSFTEFSYPLFQSYDFYHLKEKEHVTVQLGGSDQYGNIVSGCEFVRKKTGQTVFGLTFPLLTRSDGKKFGKSESGAIWLDPNKTSPYHLYQYLLNIPDADVTTMMERLTFIDIDEIDFWKKKIEERIFTPFEAQKILAGEVTRFIHGDEGLESALEATKTLMSNTLDPDKILENIRHLPHITVVKKASMGISILDLCVSSGVFTSKGEGRKLIRAGGVSINGKKCDDVKKVITPKELLQDQFLIISIGKKKKIAFKFTENDPS